MGCVGHCQKRHNVQLPPTPTPGIRVLSSPPTCLDFPPLPPPRPTHASFEGFWGRLRNTFLGSKLGFESKKLGLLTTQIAIQIVLRHQARTQDAVRRKMTKKKRKSNNIPSCDCPAPLERGWHVHVDDEWVSTEITTEDVYPGFSLEKAWICPQGRRFHYVYEFFSPTEGRQINTATRKTRDVKWFEGAKYARNTEPRSIPTIRRVFIHAINVENDGKKFVVHLKMDWKVGNLLDVVNKRIQWECNELRLAAMSSGQFGLNCSFETLVCVS